MYLIGIINVLLLVVVPHRVGGVLAFDRKDLHTSSKKGGSGVAHESNVVVRLGFCRLPFSTWGASKLFSYASILHK